jgi:hypothetical protein
MIVIDVIERWIVLRLRSEEFNGLDEKLLKA